MFVSALALGARAFSLFVFEVHARSHTHHIKEL
jgi:hypothetical protein